MGMLISKLPLVFIIAHESCIVNRQIGVEELKYGVTGNLLQCVSKKNISDIFSCNFRKHCQIFIIFGTHVTEKVSNQ